MEGQDKYHNTFLPLTRPLGLRAWFLNTDNQLMINEIRRLHQGKSYTKLSKVGSFCLVHIDLPINTDHSSTKYHHDQER